MTKTKYFDGTRIDIMGTVVVITEGATALDLHLDYLTDGLVRDAVWRTSTMADRWVADRLVFCAELARREITAGKPPL